MVLLTVRRRAAKMVGETLINTLADDVLSSVVTATDLKYVLPLDHAEKQYGHLMTNCLLKVLQHEKEEQVLRALAHCSSGVACVIPGNHEIEAPIVVQSSEFPSLAMMFIFAGKKSRATFELVTSKAQSIQLLTYIFAEEDAAITLRISHRGDTAWYATRAMVKQKANVSSSFFVAGGNDVTEYVKMYLAQEQATGTSHSLYIAHEQERMKSVKEIIHLTKCTTSEMCTRAVVAKEATVHVQQETTLAKEADESAAEQHARALVLGKNARFQAVPKLDILASNVKASHGVSVGALDEEALLYAQARGLGAEEARKLLIEAFIREALMHHPNHNFEELV